MKPKKLESLDIAALEREGAELLELEKILPQDDPVVQFTPDKLKKLHDRIEEKRARQHRIIRMRRAVVLVAAVAVTVSMLMMSVDAVRHSVFEFFNIRTTEAVTYGYANLPAQSDQPYAPEKLPDIGLVQQIYKSDPQTGVLHMFYETPDTTQYINIFIASEPQRSHVDAENLDKEHSIKIGRYEGVISTKEERTTLVWRVEELTYTCSLYTNISENAAIEVAKSINFE